jgi:hypothetical protein
MIVFPLVSDSSTVLTSDDCLTTLFRHIEAAWPEPFGPGRLPVRGPSPLRALGGQTVTDSGRAGLLAHFGLVGEVAGAGSALETVATFVAGCVRLHPREGGEQLFLGEDRGRAQRVEPQRDADPRAARQRGAREQGAERTGTACRIPQRVRAHSARSGRARSGCPALGEAVRHAFGRRRTTERHAPRRAPAGREAMLRSAPPHLDESRAPRCPGRLHGGVRPAPTAFPGLPGGGFHAARPRAHGATPGGARPSSGQFDPGSPVPGGIEPLRVEVDGHHPGRALMRAIHGEHRGPRAGGAVDGESPPGGVDVLQPGEADSGACRTLPAGPDTASEKQLCLPGLPPRCSAMNESHCGATDRGDVPLWSPQKGGANRQLHVGACQEPPLK